MQFLFIYFLNFFVSLQQLDICLVILNDFMYLLQVGVPSQGFFSKFLKGGGLKIFGPRRSLTGMKLDGGDLRKKSK